MSKTFFCVGVYGDGFNAPVHLDGYTLAEAKRAKAWQEIGSGQHDVYHIAQPVPGKPGVMETTTGGEITVQRGYIRDDVWAAFIARYWQ